MLTRSIIYAIFVICVSLFVLSPTATAGEKGILKTAVNTSSVDEEVFIRLNPTSPTPERIFQLGPLNMQQGVIDTLSWRTLDFTHTVFTFSTQGDSAAIWFEPSGACVVKAFRIYIEHIFGDPSAGNILLDIRKSRYKGHIMTTDSTDVNGWVGSFEGDQWVPGWVMGHPPMGEHIWGPFPLTLNEGMSGTWVEVPTHHLGEPQLTGEPFFVSMVFYPITRIGLNMENLNTVPFHVFKYYADCCGPDGVHDGWFLRRFSVWVEVIVEYNENTPPKIHEMTLLNDTYAPGPFSVEAKIEDRDAEDPDRAGVASAYLCWEKNGAPDSIEMSGPPEGGVFTGQIPQLTKGDVVHYSISATDRAGALSSTLPETFARLEPANRHADILLVDYYKGWDTPSDFYRQLLDSLNYAYEYWGVEAHQGIDESVSSYGWRTAVIFGFNTWLPFYYLVPPLPTRAYEDNIWAGFLGAGIPEVPANMFYAEKEYCELNQEYGEWEFVPGDFAYDYLGCASVDECGGFGCTDRTFYGVSGDPVTGVFSEEPFRQTWALPFAQEYWMDYTTAAETGVDIFFTESGDGSGLRCESESFKTVFLPWDFTTLLKKAGTDTVPSDDVRVLLDNVLQWFGTEQELVRGDIDGNGSTNILDAVTCVNIILGTYDPTSDEYARADCNGDRGIDIADALGLINLILGIGSCPP